MPPKRNLRSLAKKPAPSSTAPAPSAPSTAPAPSTATAKKPAKKPTTKRKKPDSDDDDDDDEEEDDDKGNREKKRQRRNYKKLEGADAVCDFCTNDPAGQALHADNPCDWTDKPYDLECKNCSNWRFQNKDQGGADHKCVVLGGRRIANRMYSDFDPILPPVRSCDACTRKGFQNTCDVDVILDIECSTCNAGRKNTNRKTKTGKPREECFVGGKKVGKPPSPTIRLGDKKWWRHACDACNEGYLQDPTPCSWLGDRTIWDRRCNKCIANNQLCTNAWDKVHDTLAIDPPTSWKVPLPDNVPYLLCSSRNTKWREICKPCYDTGANCEVLSKAPNGACERCTQVGIDCFGKDGPTFPIHDLSRVGFGSFQPFQICTECQEHNGNCDHQRPCDTCVQNNRDCDPWDLNGRQGQKANLINKSETYNCNKRFEKPPGPLYYLGMGYGPSGVNDVKDGTRIAEWVGPMANIYQIHNAGRRVDTAAEAVIRLRNKALPAGVAPNATNGGPMGQIMPSDLTTQQLEQVIRASWPQATPPTQKQITEATSLRIPTGNPPSPLVAKPRKMPRINRQHPPKTDGKTDGGIRPPPRPRPGARPTAPTPTFSFAPVQTAPTPTAPTPAAPTPTFSFAPVQGMMFQAAPRMPIPDPRATWGLPPYLVAPIVPAIPIDPALTSYSSPHPTLPTAPAVAQDNSALGQTRQQGTGTEAPGYDEDGLSHHAQQPDINSRLLAGMDQVLEPDHPVGPAGSGLNPFLGIPEDAVPDWQHPQLLNRWQRANRLEGLDMRHWQTVEGVAADSNSSMLFATANGQPVADVPSRDVLEDIPLHPITDNNPPDAVDLCMEPGAFGQGYCANIVEDLTGCQSLAHCNRTPYEFLVCDDCNKASIADVLQLDNPITSADLVNMRAYLCTACAEHIGESQQNAATYRPAGAARVWGKYRNGTQPDGGVALPGTGCACATKVIDRRLCRFHRLFYAEQMLRQALLMQEWRLNQFGKAVCPACLLTKSAQAANLSADQGDFGLLASTAWACLSCNDWVVNQYNNVYGRPCVVPGFWANGTMKAEEAIREVEDDADVEMAGM